MNFADFESAWQSSANEPNPALMARLHQQLSDRLRRRRRGHTIFLSAVVLVMTIFTVGIVQHVVAPAPGSRPVELSNEWGLIPFFGLPWLALVVLVTWQRRHRVRHAGFDRDLLSSISASIDENRTQARRGVLISGLLVLSALVLVVVVDQLEGAGKAGPEIMLPAFVIWPIYVVGMASWILIFRRRRLRERYDALTRLQESYCEVGGVDPVG